MARSKVSICNQALTMYVGGAPINSMDEATPNAEACLLHYDAALMALLERHWWVFAKSRRSLASLQNDRANVWQYAYQRPVEAIALHWVNDPTLAAAAMSEGRSPDTHRETTQTTIYCDVPFAACEFTAEVDDPGLYPPSFSDALAAELAARITQQITESGPRIRTAREAAMERLDIAIALDMRNEPPIQTGLPDYLRDRGLS